MSHLFTNAEFAAHNAKIRAEALREAAEEWATGAWSEAFNEEPVEDDVSAVRAMEKWLIARARAVATG